jgi:hypothetical protein
LIQAKIGENGFASTASFLASPRVPSIIILFLTFRGGLVINLPMAVDEGPSQGKENILGCAPSAGEGWKPNSFIYEKPDFNLDPIQFWDDPPSQLVEPYIEAYWGMAWRFPEGKEVSS